MREREEKKRKSLRGKDRDKALRRRRNILGLIVERRYGPDRLCRSLKCGGVTPAQPNPLPSYHSISLSPSLQRKDSAWPALDVVGTADCDRRLTVVW